MESVSKRDFYDDSNMFYMASQSFSKGQTKADLDHQECMRDLVAFHAEMLGDIMYFHQAIKQPDAQEFIKAIVKEVEAHMKDTYWKHVKQSKVLPGTGVLPPIWAMYCKWNLTTNKIKGHKARLNTHGGKQVYDMNYYETYAPVVTWFAIKFMIIVAIMLMWLMQQIDFIQANTKAQIEQDMYMELSQGIETKHGNSKDYILKPLVNLHGQKQAGWVCNQYMVKKLWKIGFVWSHIDECVFYHDDVIFIMYIDYGMSSAILTIC